MHPDSSLLHPNIQESGRGFEVMAKAGIKKIDKSDLLFWLEKQPHDWFKNRTHKWMRSLYTYFNKKWSPTELEANKEVTIDSAREQGTCMYKRSISVFSHRIRKTERQEIRPFLNELHILQSTFLKGKGQKDIKVFLEDIGVQELHPENLINESILPSI